MKKFKYFIFSIICLFSCCIVFADNEVVIRSITPVYDEESSIVVTNENNNHSVTFNEKDQVVKYNVVIENTSGYELKVDKIDLTKPTEDFLIYELKGISTGDVIKSNETKELVISLETTETNNLDTEFNDELLATINFEKSVTNPFTSTKGLIVILLAAVIVTGVCIIIYRNSKAARYMALVIAFISIVPVVNAKDTVTLQIKVNVTYVNSLIKFTASTPVYKNLQKFKHWEENGKVVSTETNYVYYGIEEKNLTPVYEDFIEVQPINDATANNWNEETLTFSTTKPIESNGWYEVGYVTEKLEKGMYIEFEVDSGSHILYGISPTSYFEKPLEHGWAKSFEKLFVAKYNIYAVTREGNMWLHENAAGTNSKTTFESPSISIQNLMKNNEKIKIKYVLDDELLMYINGVLFTASNKETWAIDENETYNLSFSGGQSAFTITDFGYDEYLTNKGNFGTPTSSPVSKESFDGKKITFLGDSITAGVGASSSVNRYSTVLSNSLGMTENNMGISGTVIATGGHRTSRINHISSIPLDSDYVGVLLGINDFDQCKNDGTSRYYCLGDFNSRDTSTIYGALHVYCQELIKRFREQDTKIFFMTPVITSWNNSVGVRDWDQSKKNACGYSLPELVNAIKEVTSYYGIVTLDLNQLSGVTSSDFSDGIHPNDSGMKKMADTIEEFLIKNYSY